MPKGFPTCVRFSSVRKECVCVCVCVFLLGTHSLVGVSGIALFLFGSVVQSSLRKRYSGSPGATPKWLHPVPLRIKRTWPARVQQWPATPMLVCHAAEGRKVNTSNRGYMHAAPSHCDDGWLRCLEWGTVWRASLTSAMTSST